MKKKIIALTITFSFSLFTFTCVSQNVGINAINSTPNASAGLDVDFTNKGLLIPRVALTSTTDATTITSAATSLLVYNTATISDVFPGYYYWDGTKWVRMINTGNSSGGDWSLTGNAGTTVGTNFLGTTDAQDFAIYTNNTEKIRVAQNGNVGIGTSGPTGKLTVVKTSNATSDHILRLTRVGTGAAGNGLFFTHGATASDYNAITGAGDIGFFFDIDGNPSLSTSTQGLVIAPWANGGSPGFGTGIKIQENGNVGIGTTTPVKLLHMIGTDGPVTSLPLLGPKDFLLIENNGNANISLVGCSTCESALKFSSDGYTGTNVQGLVRYSYLRNELSLSTDYGNRLVKDFVIDSTGNVGISTTTPGAKLEIVGTSGTTLKIVDGNQAAGKVLTSDATGQASWQSTTPASAQATTSVALTTSSTLWVDMPTTIVTLTTSGGNLLMSFTSQAANGTPGAFVAFRFVVDGIPVTSALFGNAALQDPPGAGPYYQQNVSATWLATGVASGTHMVKVQWKVSSGSAIAPEGGENSERTLVVVEIK